MSERDPKPTANVPSEAPPQPPIDAKMCRNAPKCAGMCQEKNSSVQNGPTGSRPLTPRQYTAARLLARGFGSVDVARHLGVNHHTIARWKRQAAFIAQMERFQRDLTTPTSRSRSLDPLAACVLNNPAEASPARRVDLDGLDYIDDDVDDDGNDEEEEISDEEFAATEAWVEQIIAAGRTGAEIPPPPPLKRPV